MQKWIKPSPKQALWWRAKILGRTAFYLGGRDATILLSALAFSFLLSVFPFIVLLLTLADYLNWTELRETIFSAFFHFFPISQEFIIRNLKILSRGLAELQIVSVLILAWSVSAFFFSLEACLDSAYRVPQYRRFSRSQVLGTAMTLLFGLIAFFFVAALRGIQILSSEWFQIDTGGRDMMEQGGMWGLSVVLTLVLFFFLFYQLPNKRRKPRQVVLEAVFAGVLWLGGNVIFKISVPLWSLTDIYGPFYVSVTLLLWAFASGLVLMATARLSADGFFSRAPSQLVTIEPALETDPEPVPEAPGLPAPRQVSPAPEPFPPGEVGAQ